jgi:hypothetical protein
MCRQLLCGRSVDVFNLREREGAMAELGQGTILKSEVEELPWLGG